MYVHLDYSIQMSMENTSVRLGPVFKVGTFGKLGYLNFGVLIIRILLFRVLYLGPLFSETSKSQPLASP